MPNWISDEDLSLSNGDSIRCEHCGRVFSVDDWHHCAEGDEASRQATENFTQAYFGAGDIVTRQFIVTITAPNTPRAFEDALSNVSTYFEDNEGHDDILQLHWKVEEIK